MAQRRLVDREKGLQDRYSDAASEWRRGGEGRGVDLRNLVNASNVTTTIKRVSSAASDGKEKPLDHELDQRKAGSRWRTVVADCLVAGDSKLDEVRGLGHALSIVS